MKWLILLFLGGLLMFSACTDNRTTILLTPSNPECQVFNTYCFVSGSSGDVNINFSSVTGDFDYVVET